MSTTTFKSCPRCESNMEYATLNGGGYVAHFCYECEILVPHKSVTVVDP